MAYTEISRGAWASKTTEEKIKYLQENPDVKVLTPTGLVEPTVQQEGQTYVNPESVNIQYKQPEKGCF